MYTYLLIRIVYAFETILSHYEWWRPTVGELFEGFQLESLGWRTASCQLSNLNPVVERGKGSELSVEQCPFFLFHEGFHFLGFSWEYWSTFSQLYYIPCSSIFPWKMAGFLHLSPGLSHFFQGKKWPWQCFWGALRGDWWCWPSPQGPRNATAARGASIWRCEKYGNMMMFWFNLG